MPITSLLIECRKFFAAVLLLSVSLCQFGYAEVAQSWKVTTGPMASLQVFGQKVLVSRQLKAALLNAEMVAVLPVDLTDDHADPMRWVMIRKASRNSAGVGYCGAGNEDLLMLIKVVKSNAVIAGKFLAQSCLKSISMDVDEFDDLLGAIKFDERRIKLSLHQSISSESDSVRQDVEIFVACGRMRVVSHQVIE